MERSLLGRALARAGRELLDPPCALSYWLPMPASVPSSWLRIAHRGASGTRPEHTRGAFLRALEIGVDMIELDVHLTKDGELVVIHDHELARTTPAQGIVREHTLAELQEIDAGAWFAPDYAGETILSLDEVLAITKGKARLNVEIKAPESDWTGVSQQLLASLGKHDSLDSTVVSCFDLGALQNLRRASSTIALGVLWAQPDLEEAWRWCAEVGAVNIHPYWRLANLESVQAAHARDLRVLVWTVNAEDDMHDMLKAGVDGIISDFPERLAALKM